MHCKVITWYDFLNNPSHNSLAKHYNLHQGLVVRRETETGNKYAWFKNHIDFWVKTKNLPQNFHEVIVGPRKAYFDIDKAESLEELEKTIEEVCLTLLKLLPIQRKDLLLFTSIGSVEGKMKFSAHIVLHNFYYSSGRQVKELYNLVYKELSPQIRDLLDPGVYSSLQNFRLLGSSKLGQKRPKVHKKLILEGEEVEFPLPHHHAYAMEILRGSLISCITQCQLLPDLYKEEEKEDEEDLESEKIKEVLRFCRSKIEEFPFRKRGIVGNRIILQRLRPSYCPTCKRKHERENPYITLRGIDVFFHCRRERFLYLGQLGEDKPLRIPPEIVKIPFP